VKTLRHAVVISLITLVMAGSARAVSDDDALGALVTSYPDVLSKFEARKLYWRDASVTEIPADQTIKSFEQTLRGASLLDQMRLVYPRGVLEAPPEVNADPGRFRNVSFFRKMYGNCWRNEVQGQIVPVVWLPRTWGYPIHATTVNGVAQKLAAISNEIDLLPDKIKRAAYPASGSFVCRGIVDTGQPSMHSYGAAIDLNISLGDYWYWQRMTKGALTYRNRMPSEIVEIFERHGFIWGGKWYHYDTMHFEYRPELLVRARN
jgi:hypothetical protein